MKTLTVRQPFAQLIALGVKTIETRSWSTKYRGELLIHAGKAETLRHGFNIGDWRTYRGDRTDRPNALPPRMFDRSVGWLTRPETPISLPLGAIVASCNLVDCVPIVQGPCIGHLLRDVPEPSLMVEPETLSLLKNGIGHGKSDQLPYGDFTPGRFAWLLEDIKPTTERCPWCRGEGYKPSDHPEFASRGVRACFVCDGAGTCDPIPAKGKQGLWNWEP